MYHPRFKGDHYDVGIKYSEMLKKQGVDFHQLIDLNRFQKDRGKKSLIILAEVFPEVCDEIRGLTDGLNYPYEEFAAWLLCMGCCYEPRGCTGFCFILDNQVIYGRNNDLPPFLKKGSASVLYQPSHGYSFIGSTSSLINFEEGLNQHGLAVAMKFIYPTMIQPGINSVFLVRYLLEKCGTTNEAIKALKSIPIASACYDVLKNTPIQDGIEHAQAILSGQHGFLCQYDNVLNFETIWSSVFDVTNRRIYRAEVNPAKIKFNEDLRTEKLKNY